MTRLADVLMRRIAGTGPLNLADYMTECLLHPTLGYYTTRDPLGETGDFTTAPEISQMFGELLGLCLAQTWLDHGQPTPFTLAELGPGRGTLMADIMRATKRVPGFHNAANILLVEASEVLRSKQKTMLSAYRVNWLDTVANLPDAPLFLVANEFFDALPIRQFRRDKNGWCETQIVTVHDRLTFALSGPAPHPALSHRTADCQPGDIVETCPMASGIIQTISACIARNGGAALIVDYGDWRSRGDTFQAVKHHKPVNPLAEPGQADLTAHVDFEALSNASDIVGSTPMTTQAELLARLGIAARAKTLTENLSGDALVSHRAAYRRLTHPEEMGTMFKAIALYKKGAAPPPGFTP